MMMTAQETLPPEWLRSRKSREERFEKPFVFHVLDKDIVIEQKAVEIENMDTLGYTVWDASLVLVKYFEKKENFKDGFWTGKRVLTLGSGTGLDAIVLSLLGASVVGTDLNVNLMKKNVDFNIFDAEKRPRIEVLRWGDEDNMQKFANEPPFDYIVASDCVYYPDLLPLFLQTLTTIASPSTKICIAAENHWIMIINMFLKQAGQYFDIVQIPYDSLDDVYRGSDFFVWEMTKKHVTADVVL